MAVRKSLNIHAKPFEMPTYINKRNERLDSEKKQPICRNREHKPTFNNLIVGDDHEEPNARICVHIKRPDSTMTDGAPNRMLKTGWVPPDQMSMWQGSTSSQTPPQSSSHTVGSPIRAQLSKALELRSIEQASSGSGSGTSRMPRQQLVLDKSVTSQQAMQENVFITHINSPCYFFVRTVSDQNVMDDFKKRCNTAALDADQPENVIVGSRYLVQMNSIWYRCDIVSACGEGGEYKVYLVDTGADYKVSKHS